MSMLPKAPGVYFVPKPITMPVGWQVALHVDESGEPIACVMVAPGHAGPAFVRDSWAWWEMHATKPSGPHPTAFSSVPALRLVTEPGKRQA